MSVRVGVRSSVVGRNASIDALDNKYDTVGVAVAVVPTVTLQCSAVQRIRIKETYFGCCAPRENHRKNKQTNKQQNPSVRRPISSAY